MIHAAIVSVGFLCITLILIILNPVLNPVPKSSRRLAPATPETAAQPTPAPLPQVTSVDGLNQLVLTALTQGQSDVYIDALVNDAARKSKVEIPAL